MKFKNLEELREELEEKKARLIELEEQDESADFDDALDCNGPIKIGGLKYQASRVLKEVDPTAYRCGLNDYNDEEQNTLTDEIEAIEADIKEAEAEEKEAAEGIEEIANKTHAGTAGAWLPDMPMADLLCNICAKQIKTENGGEEPGTDSELGDYYVCPECGLQMCEDCEEEHREAHDKDEEGEK